MLSTIRITTVLQTKACMAATTMVLLLATMDQSTAQEMRIIAAIHTAVVSMLMECIAEARLLAEVCTAAVCTQMECTAVAHRALGCTAAVDTEVATGRTIMKRACTEDAESKKAVHLAAVCFQAMECRAGAVCTTDKACTEKACKSTTCTLACKAVVMHSGTAYKVLAPCTAALVVHTALMTRCITVAA